MRLEFDLAAARDGAILSADATERRTVAEPLAYRAAEAEAGTPGQLEGYAAVFDQDTQIGADAWGWTERIAPGAFRESIGSDDIRALFNHDSNQVLGRNTAKTLELSEDKKGLRTVIQPPDTAAARDVVALVARGDVSGMSFAFRTVREEWAEPKAKGELPRRTILEAQLFDVGPVTFPAYPQTSIAARDRSSALLDAIRAERDADGDRVRCLALVTAQLSQQGA